MDQKLMNHAGYEASKKTTMYVTLKHNLSDNAILLQSKNFSKLPLLLADIVINVAEWLVATGNAEEQNSFGDASDTIIN